MGLLIGLPAGIFIALLLPSPQSGGQPLAVPSQIHDLTRKLELATEAKERADRQLEQFQKLAEQMTTSFNNLERRFKLLEEEQRVRDSQAAQASAQRPAAVPPQVPAPAQPKQGHVASEPQLRSAEGSPPPPEQATPADPSNSDAPPAAGPQ